MTLSTARMEYNEKIREIYAARQRARQGDDSDSDYIKKMLEMISEFRQYMEKKYYPMIDEGTSTAQRRRSPNKSGPPKSPCHCFQHPVTEPFKKFSQPKTHPCLGRTNYIIVGETDAGLDIQDLGKRPFTTMLQPAHHQRAKAEDTRRPSLQLRSRSNSSAPSYSRPQDRDDLSPVATPIDRRTPRSLFDRRSLRLQEVELKR